MLDRLQNLAISALLTKAVICSFCRKGPDKAGPLVEAPGPHAAGGVYIGEECAAFATSIFERRRSDAERPIN